MRGNHLTMAHKLLDKRSIPASAGQPAPKQRMFRLPRVYPRECGATSLVPAEDKLLSGLSPRVRGNHGKGVTIIYYDGSIPASAGQPS